MIGIGAAPAWRRGRHGRGAAMERRQRLRAERNRCLDRDRSRRFHPDPLSALGNGAGQHDRAADDDHRGAAVRLVEGAHRIRFAQPQRPREQGLWRHVLERQPFGASVAEEDAAGRRQRARAPHRGRRGAAGTCRPPNARPRQAWSRMRPRGARCVLANWRPTRRRSSSPRSRRSRRPTSSPSSASRCRASTWCTRSTARPSSGSTRRFPTWSSRRSPPARYRAASSRASMSQWSLARLASSRWCKLENAVAVVATGSFWRAKQALARLQPEWDVGEAGKRRQRAALQGIPRGTRAVRC